jgi:uncharacterized protein YndB with AHSA1/START domain
MTTIPAVQQSVTVNAPVEKAFKVYTEGFNSWWPPQHHIGTAELAEAVLEAKPGGRWYERGVDGSECEWGQVLAYEPPTRLLLSWQINGAWQYDPELAHASEVEVRFTDLGAGRTRIDLEHRGFERHGETGPSVHDGVSGEGGWPMIMGRLAKSIESA